MPDRTTGASTAATTTAPQTLEVRLAGGSLALNRFLMTLQNKRMPVSGIRLDGDREGARATVLLDCPPEAARRYALLLEGSEDVREIEVSVQGEARGVPGLDYEGRKFVSVENSPSGEVGPETVFEYHQDGDVVWATYGGGSVRFGTLVAKADGEGRLDARYGHVNTSGELMTGECSSVPELLPDGRVRLREEWRWTSGDRSSGRSVVEEVEDGSNEEGE
jgi:hypothetical protein